MAELTKAQKAEAARYAGMAKGLGQYATTTGAKTGAKIGAKIGEAATLSSAAPVVSGLVDNPMSFYQRDEEKALYSKQNPPFIFPGPDRKIATLGKSVPINRGYIRRLTEFYKNVEGAKTLSNMRCNFQFNPELITRSIEANYDMQYFFNQDPDQLAQPIPGQATFGFSLLFNREAEVASGKYRSKDGKMVEGKLVPDPLTNSNQWTPEGVRQSNAKKPDYILDDYDPAWVCEIGVLADILILDDIIGQGLARDLIEQQKAGTLKPSTSSSTKDATDTTNNDLGADFDSTKLSKFSTNVGNKAYLVPTPIRMLLSEWFMVEGYVMRHTVTFNKFDSNMIPTQASVELQIQALYIGFAQKDTFLTDINKTVDDPTNGSNGGPNNSGTTSDVIEQTAEGTKRYLKNIKHLQGKSNDIDLLDAVFANGDNKYEFNFAGHVSDEGQTFYNDVATQSNGGGLSFTFTGEIKIWWARHVSNATNDRITTKEDANTSGPIQYASGPPPKQGSWDFKQWGTKEKPFIVSCAELPVYYIDEWKILDAQFMIFGKLAAGAVEKIGSAVLINVNPFKTKGSSAYYTFTRPAPTMPIPFKQDEFNVELTITIKATRYGDTKPIEQKIKSYYNNLKADDDKLFSYVSPIPAYNSAQDQGRGYGPRTA